MISQKERMLFQDQKSHEEMCVEKYTKYANEAQDQELKQLFTTHASHEKQHFNTLNEILNGQTPAMSGQGQQMTAQNPTNPSGQTVNQNDISLAKDMLTTEKYVSGTYDTVIFECQDHNIRQALNHIQKEEQQHGEDLFNYLNSRGAYPMQ
ncbi:spore coat protein [Desulfosporosinus sp. SB140]|uniref:spore coat protein n=1 Tax=Desulfosporosinus paludis TaxID=3115649 RepID=UPI003890DC8A